MTDEQLCKNVQSSFERNLAADKKAASLLEKINAGNGNYVTAGDYAECVGESLRKAYQTNLSGIDGSMHWSTAKAVIEPTLKEEYDIVSGVAADVQQALNKKAGMGLKAVKASYNSEAVSGIMNKVCSYESYDKAAWVLRDDSVSFARSVVDQTLKENINFQGKAGRAARVIRRAEAKCCDWCADLDGIYEYPNTPEDIYRRHDNCRCDVEYDPGTGKLQNVHTKEWRDADERDRIEERKAFAGLNAKTDKESLKTAYLGAGSSSNVADGIPRIIGNISPEKTSEAIVYFNDQIRYGENETAIIVDKYGTVWQSNGNMSTVAVNGIDLDGAAITHNHPASNGIVSFSEDDFNFLKDNPSIKELTAVNEKYTYTVSDIKGLENLSYSEYYREAIKNHSLASNEDLHHETFELISKDGYLHYVRKEIE